jgi:hypothetical protein
MASRSGFDPIKGRHSTKGDKIKDLISGAMGGASQGLMMQMMMGNQGSQAEEACQLRQLNGEPVAWDEKTKQCVATGIARPPQDPNAPGVQRTGAGSNPNWFGDLMAQGQSILGNKRGSAG